MRFSISDNIKILKLAEKYGLRSIRCKSPSTPVFEYENGVVYLELNSQEDMDDGELLIHNLSHFICASPKRRYLPDFGLGNSPDSDKEIIYLIPEHESMLEEQIVSSLEFFIYKYLEKPHPDRKLNPLHLHFLKSWGLITDDQNLSLKLRENPDEVTLKGVYEERPEKFKDQGYSEEALKDFFK